MVCIWYISSRSGDAFHSKIQDRLYSAFPLADL